MLTCNCYFNCRVFIVGIVVVDVFVTGAVAVAFVVVDGDADAAYIGNTR